MVKPGYKQTEVGEIPEDWDAIKLGSLALIQRGASPRPIDSPIWFDENSGIGWLRISDVSRAKKYLLETTQNLSQAGVSNSRYVSSGNLVMSICATVGRPILTKKDVCIHDGFVVFGGVKADLNYLYYILEDIEGEWTKHGQTGSQMNLNTGLINATFVPVPRFEEEQKSIAKALSDVDELIVSLESLITKKRDIKTAAMQQLLTGKQRLPGFGEGKGYKQTELCQIPEDWDLYSIPDVTKPGAESIKIGPFGSSLKKEYLSRWGYKVYGQENVYEKDMKLGDRYLPLEHFQKLKSCKVEPDDFLVSMMGTIGKCFVVPNNIEVGIIDSHLIRIRFDAAKVSSEYLIHLFQTKIIDDQIKRLSVGGIMEGLSSKIVKQLQAPLGDIEEQREIARFLSDIDQDIESLCEKLNKVKNIKQGMMQELLTGRTRLVKPAKHKVA